MYRKGQKISFSDPFIIIDRGFRYRMLARLKKISFADPKLTSWIRSVILNDGSGSVIEGCESARNGEGMGRFFLDL
jgi:hypothetical protein